MQTGSYKIVPITDLDIAKHFFPVICKQKRKFQQIETDFRFCYGPCFSFIVRTRIGFHNVHLPWGYCGIGLCSRICAIGRCPITKTVYFCFEDPAFWRDKMNKKKKEQEKS